MNEDRKHAKMSGFLPHHEQSARTVVTVKRLTNEEIAEQTVTWLRKIYPDCDVTKHTVLHWLDKPTLNFNSVYHCGDQEILAVGYARALMGDK